MYVCMYVCFYVNFIESRSIRVLVRLEVGGCLYEC